MEIIQNVWLSLNIVFGLWSARNWQIYFCARLFGKRYQQNQIGMFLDLIIPSSILAYYLTYHL